MNTHRFAAIAAGCLSLALTVAPAIADTTNVGDAAYDAIRLTDDGTITYGDFDIDLRNIYIDHGTRDLQIASRFTYLDATSWTQQLIALDTNNDSVTDYTVLWDSAEGISGVVREYPDGTSSPTCINITTSQSLGVNGSTNVKFPRSCIGNPASVRVHVDVWWIGLSQADTDLYFTDSAPGELLDEPVTFSHPVASSNTGTATSPSAPKVQTKLSAALSKSTVKARAAAPKVTVKATAAGNPAGKVVIADNGKTLKTVSAHAGKKITYTLPRTLKPGRHSIKVTFTPNDTKKYLPTSKTLKLKVTK
ncbi:hypothetical protein NODU109028_21195 [Nocardioides dubius]|uniref:Ig-like domain (Group 3) n=1 Tax=Nocardioides dubius TaxID=317019 RepID=A0ABP4E382_9ACTN